MYQPATADATTAPRINPWAPVTDEYDYEVTRVVGKIPREIAGTLYRNGPSQRVEPREGYAAMHLFDGDGLVHGEAADGSPRA